MPNFILMVITLEGFKEIIEWTYREQLFWDMMIGGGHYSFFKELELNLKNQGKIN